MDSNNVYDFVICVVICHESNKVFEYNLLKQLWDVMNNLLLSSVMLGVTYLVYKIVHHNYAIVLQIVVGIAVYLLGAAITKNKNLAMVIGLIKNRKKCNGRN